MCIITALFIDVIQEPAHTIYLPEEVILEILVYLPPNDLLLRASLVCKHWKELSERPP